MVKTNTFPICFGVLRAMRHYHICHTIRGRVECGVTHRQIATLTHDADYRLRDPLDAIPDQVSTHVRLCIAGRHCAARSAVRPRARTTPTGVPRLDQDLTNCLRPPAVSGTASRHPGRLSDAGATHAAWAGGGSSCGVGGRQATPGGRREHPVRRPLSPP